MLWKRQAAVCWRFDKQNEARCKEENLKNLCLRSTETTFRAKSAWKLHPTIQHYRLRRTQQDGLTLKCSSWPPCAYDLCIFSAFSAYPTAYLHHQCQYCVELKFHRKHGLYTADNSVWRRSWSAASSCAAGPFIAQMIGITITWKSNTICFSRRTKTSANTH